MIFRLVQNAATVNADLSVQHGGRQNFCRGRFVHGLTNGQCKQSLSLRMSEPVRLHKQRRIVGRIEPKCFIAFCSSSRLPTHASTRLFLPPPRRLCFHSCLSVCLSVNRITQKLLIEYLRNFVGWLDIVRNQSIRVSVTLTQGQGREV